MGIRMTPTEELAKLRAKLEWMVRLAEAATPGPWLDDWRGPGDWGPESYSVRTEVQTVETDTVAVTSRWARGAYDAAFIAAAGPELMLRIAREALFSLDRHREQNLGMGNTACLRCWSPIDLNIAYFKASPDAPCPEVAAILWAWLP